MIRVGLIKNFTRQRYSAFEYAHVCFLDVLLNAICAAQPNVITIKFTNCNPKNKTLKYILKSNFYFQPQAIFSLKTVSKKTINEDKFSECAFQPFCCCSSCLSLQRAHQHLNNIHVRFSNCATTSEAVWRARISIQERPAFCTKSHFRIRRITLHF